MSEVPSMKLDVDGAEFQATRENTTLFTFLGEGAMHDHVFLQVGKENTQIKGTFIFKALCPEPYEKIRRYMVENSYPAHVNSLEVPQCDQDAFETAVMKAADKIGDTLPEGW